MIKKDQIYAPKEDIKITCMTSWRAPFTGRHERTLPKGEKFKICNDPPETATAVYCDPIRYKKLHKQMVPKLDRLKFWIYSGYYFCIDLKTIMSKCDLIEDN
jgi:hypothetical protein